MLYNMLCNMLYVITWYIYIYNMVIRQNNKIIKEQLAVPRFRPYSETVMRSYLSR